MRPERPKAGPGNMILLTLAISPVFPAAAAYSY